MCERNTNECCVSVWCGYFWFDVDCLKLFWNKTVWYNGLGIASKLKKKTKKLVQHSRMKLSEGIVLSLVWLNQNTRHKHTTGHGKRQSPYFFIFLSAFNCITPLGVLHIYSGTAMTNTMTIYMHRAPRR